jgi:glycosyltransferase involved in cell wall biosynthesis
LEIELPPVSVIIPAYNEERWIGTTVSSVLDSGFPCEVVVVDDGSTDRTREILQSFGARVKLLVHATNKGKGGAVAAAVSQASGEILVFLDAHLLGLEKNHLLLLVLPLVEGMADVTIGEAIPADRPPIGGVSAVGWIISGQRAYFKKDLVPLLPKLEQLGWGVEVFLFRRFRNRRTMLLYLQGVKHLSKLDKQTPQQAAIAYLRETSEVTRALVGFDDLPRVRRELYLAWSEYVEDNLEKAKAYVDELRGLWEKLGPQDD